MVCACQLGIYSLAFANPGEGAQIQKNVATPTGPVKPSLAFHYAYQDYLKGHYDLALSAFQKFIEDFPESSLAPKAYYYQAECYEEQGNLKEATQALIILRDKYKTSRQIPAALFKLGKIMEKIDQPQKARAYWSILLKNHRGSPEAKLAARRLDRMSN